MINVVIIENDTDASNYLSKLLKNPIFQINIVGSTKSIKEGIALISSSSPELVFLDIHLDDGLGFEILDNIHSKNFEVIFVTAYDTYYEKAIEHFAFNYLLKPIDPLMLEKVINRYQQVKSRHSLQSKYDHFREFIKESNSKILLHTGQHYKSIYLDDIISCTADGNYTSFTLKDHKPILANNILKHYDKLLSNRGFFRANRSCLINISHIESIFRKETIILDNGDKVQVSGSNREQLSLLLDSFK
ncbi:LytTR family DNA-binding domain-containing protein [uncultured Aquimarina sp.]|uniref:LytR/AlgR family response regulator transcription factor n=1 Tax=uncultured Aquimarina sp. TaxID=575652 RepID=UPI002623FEF8|nr:LytTR family DNA-binding domain-containing protein [uncultured Aquimarina sp.]